MHRVDGPGATPQNTFTEGDPQLGIAPTEVTADIANAWQEELAHLVESSGLALSKPDNTQVRQAIDRVVGNLRTRSNAFLNGDFRLWQRGTSHVLSNTAKYIADRWRATCGAGGAATASQQIFAPGQVEVPGLPYSFLRWDQTTGGTGTFFLQQRCEFVDTFAGEQVHLQFHARANVGSPINLTPQLVQNFGTGGSTQVSNNQSVISVTGSAWTRYGLAFNVPSITGKAIGNHANLQERDDWLGLALNMPTSKVFQLDIADVQLKLGNAPSDFLRSPLEDELAACQRYFETSYPLNVAPGTSGSPAGAVASLWDRAVDISGSNSIIRCFQPYSLKVHKRGPNGLVQVTWYHPDVGTISTIAYGASSVNAPGASDQSRIRLPSITVLTAHLLTGLQPVRAHWTFDAEL